MLHHGTGVLHVSFVLLFYFPNQTLLQTQTIGLAWKGCSKEHTDGGLQQGLAHVSRGQNWHFCNLVCLCYGDYKANTFMFLWTVASFCLLSIFFKCRSKLQIYFSLSAFVDCRKWRGFQGTRPMWVCQRLDSSVIYFPF